MPVTFSYAPDGRLNIQGLACDCGCPHQTPTQDIYVGTDIVNNLPAYILKRGLGKKCVLAADNNTYPLAGARVEALLTRAGFSVTPCVITRKGEMKPDESAVGELLLSIQPDTDFLISVGSGSLTDTTRVNARRCGLPFVAVGTAPSMDGYTSTTAPLMLRGVKIHRAGVCPEIIVCDLNILRTAPMRMVRSGFGDVLGKYLAIADWRIGKIINDEPYCPTCASIVLDAVQTLMDNVDEIAQKTEKGMRALIEGLLLAGLTALILDHTRAVASVEHNISFYWEMQQLAKGLTPPMHGEGVGVGTLLIYPLFERFRDEDLSKVDILSAARACPTREARVQWMNDMFGEKAAAQIMRENQADFIAPEERLRRAQAAVTHAAEIRQVLSALPPYAVLEDAMRRVGAPMTAEDLGIDRAQLCRSMLCAKDYRTRYTLLKLLDEMGLHEAYMADYK